MLDSMQDIEAASNLLSIDTSTQNALDVHYSNLGCDINELPPTSEQFEVIKVTLLFSTILTKLRNILKIPKITTILKFSIFTKLEDGKKSHDLINIDMTILYYYGMEVLPAISVVFYHKD